MFDQADVMSNKNILQKCIKILKILLILHILGIVEKKISCIQNHLLNRIGENLVQICFCRKHRRYMVVIKQLFLFILHHLI